MRGVKTGVVEQRLGLGPGLLTNRRRVTLRSLHQFGAGLFRRREQLLRVGAQGREGASLARLAGVGLLLLKLRLKLEDGLIA